MRKIIISLLIITFFSISAIAETQKPLPGNQAFALTSELVNAHQIVLTWQIAPGYYLYQDRLKVQALNTSKAAIAPITLPAGHEKSDAIRGKYQAYSDRLVIPVSVSGSVLNLKIDYQGCSSAGFCYPPMSKYLHINLSKAFSPSDITANLKDSAQAAAVEEDSMGSQWMATTLLQGHHFIWVILSFLFLGLLLAFTPCVLPMVPILSSIIVGYGRNISTRKAFALSLSYVLGMAIAYAAAGMLVALAGSRIQIALQTPWVIVLFSALFVLLAISLFGWYDIRLPNRMHQRLVSWSHRHTGGTYVGVFMMGVFSTLIVSPCVSAPLVGVLTYIGNSGDVVLGGVALLALGLGMGIPLLLLGASAGKLLPRAGQWMDVVKQFFGLLMLGLAIWMVSRILPGSFVLFLWAMLAMMCAFFVWRIEHSKKMLHKVHQGLGLVILSYSFILIGGSMMGKTDPFYWLANKTIQVAASAKPVFSVVKNMSQLESQLATAKENKKAVILDFYADWCEACVLMDRNVFSQPEVQEALNHFILIRADVTANNAFDQAMLKRYQVIAPPTMLFFDVDGRPEPEQNIVGEVSSKELLATIHHASMDRGINQCEFGTLTC